MISQIVLAFAAADEMRGAHLPLELALRVYVVASMMKGRASRSVGVRGTTDHDA